MNPYLIEFEIKEKRRQMLEEAKRQRLLKDLDGPKIKATDRIFLILADLLIRSGETIKQRYSGGHTYSQGLSRK